MNGIKKVLILGVGVTTLVLVTAFSQTSDFKAGKGMDIFYNVLKVLNLEYVDNVDNDKLLRKATDEMLSILDPYTVFLDEKDMVQFKIATTGKYGGVGSLVKPPKDGGYASISMLYENFPMHKAGVTPGDSIVAIDGIDVKGLPVQEITEKMKGEPGAIVNMKMKKLRTGEIITYPVKREVVAISPVDYYGFVSKGVGFISFNTFSAGGAKDVTKAFMEMKKTGKLESLILDLRNNGGGLVSEAVEIMSLFVPKGSDVVSMKGKDKKGNKVYKTRTNPIDLDIPIVVIINSRSASASEIVAGALQDYDRAYIVGERSFGKGLVQVPRPVGYDSYVKLTVAKYYTPSGRCIQSLDYSHRKDDGSVGHIPDSLITEFKSKGGRSVYDGGGIMPDSILKPDYLSLFSASVLARGYVEDFATEYYRKNKTIAPVREFTLSDKDFKKFGDYILDKEIHFESGSEKIVMQLRENAKKERNLDLIKKELDIIEKNLKVRDNAKSLKENKEEIINIIEPEIISKYYFNSGRVEKAIMQDNQIKRSISILSDIKGYKDVLKNRSPKKN